MSGSCSSGSRSCVEITLMPACLRPKSRTALRTDVACSCAGTQMKATSGLVSLIRCTIGVKSGSVRFPTSNPDLTPIVQRIKDTKPDFPFIWVPAQEQATSVLKAVRDFGLKQAGVNVISTQDLLPDEQLPLIGDVAIGLVTSGIYSTAADRPANKAFLAAWDREYAGKAIPDFLSVDGWDGMSAIVDLIKETKGKFTSNEAMSFLS